MSKKKDMDFSIDGMHCASCAISLDKSLNKLNGVNKVNVDLNSNKAHVEINPKEVSMNDIDKVVESLGFKILKDEVKLKISGMHCASCVLNVERFVGKLNGIFNVHADLTSGIVTISYDKNKVSIEDMVKVIEDLGFEYLGLDSEINEFDEEKLYQNDLNQKRNRIVVGLIFSLILMGIMYGKLMIPYLTMGQLSLMISIIPFIYVSYPIIKAGLAGVMHKNLNMDVMYTMGILVAYFSSILGTFNFILNSSFMLYDTALMLPSFLMIGRYLEAKAKRKTSSSIKQLIGLQPKTAILVNLDDDGNILKEKEIFIENIDLNDILLVKPGEKIPVDGIVVVGESFVDESMITGEANPKLKDHGETVFAGTLNQDSILKIQAQKIGKETVLSQIIMLVEKAQSSKPPVQGIADKVVGYFIPTIISISILVFVSWYFIFNASLLFSLTTMISILVVACPCALGLATPTAITVGMGRAAEYGILVKNGETLETAESINVAVFDKTGTITEGKPEVVDIIPLNHYSSDEIISYIASVENNSNHPIAKAIVDYANKNNVSLINTSNFENIVGKGLKSKINNKKVLVGNESLLIMEGIKISNNILVRYNELIYQAKTSIFLVVDEQVEGILSLMDKIKSNSKDTIKNLQDMGIETYMVTGDNEKTANVVADNVGIYNVVSNVLPNEKLDKVENLEKSIGNVLFVGDGINDAPAISGADIGIALGDGTDIAMESGDIVLMESDLENVVAAIQFSKKIMKRIKENIFWAFAYNGILIPIAAGILYPFFGILFRPELAALAMALSSVTVISLSLLLKSYVPPIKRNISL